MSEATQRPSDVFGARPTTAMKMLADYLLAKGEISWFAAKVSRIFRS